MNTAVMVGTDEDQVLKCIRATAAEPSDMMCLTYSDSIERNRIPGTDLASPTVELTQLPHQIPIPARRSRHEILPALLSQPRRLCSKECRNTLWIAEHKERFQLFFRQQPRPRLKR